MSKLETATFAGGCFWCTEAIFQKLKGVASVTPGYSGGHIDNPSYEQVCSGSTGHAEAIQIKFDPSQISYKDLVYVFLKTHDPTQKDGQGADIGTQYRSAIFYHTPSQKKQSEKLISDLQKDYARPIVTQVSRFKNFFEAEDYHKNYYENNRNAGYCRLVIDPKITKLQKDFKHFLVEEKS